MFNFLINFCIITFLCYAVAGPVKAILFPQKRRARHAAVRTARPQPRKQQKPVLVKRKKAARKKLRAA